MNSHTPKKVSVSCSLIKKKGDWKDNFDFVFGEVPEAKLSLKGTIFASLWDFRGTGQTEFLEAAVQSLEMSSSKILFSSCGLSWNLSRGISCAPSGGGWHHQKPQHRRFQQFPSTPRENLGQKKSQKQLINERFRTKNSVEMKKLWDHAPSININRLQVIITDNKGIKHRNIQE